jgi:hypothetical protein
MKWLEREDQSFDKEKHEKIVASLALRNVVTQFQKN